VPQVTQRFLAARRAAGYSAYLSPKAVVPLLGYLRGLGVAPLLACWQHCLVTERGLGAATARDYSSRCGRLWPGGRRQAALTWPT